jgi:hypothetical protein
MLIECFVMCLLCLVMPDLPLIAYLAYPAEAHLERLVRSIESVKELLYLALSLGRDQIDEWGKVGIIPGGDLLAAVLPALVRSVQSG